MSLRWSDFAILVLLTLTAFAVPLYHYDQTLSHDWGYFNSLSWLVKTSIGYYGEWNVQDPWGCGGLDVWANPQHRLSSPLGLLDLWLAPHLANLVGFVWLGALGVSGAFLFFLHFGFGRPVAFLCSFLFINSSWLTLHFSAGHIPFGGMQLLPWAGLCALHIRRPVAQLGAAMLLVLLLWDGGVYALIFSVYLMLTLWLARLGGASLGDLRALKEAPLRTALLALALVAAVLARLIPLLAVGGRTQPERETPQVLPGLLLRMFYDPRQYSPPGDFVWRQLHFHEFGCYVGVPLTALLVWYLWRHRDARRAHKRLLVAMAIWFWAAMAWGGDFNPWQLHRMTPILNMAHVQARSLLLLFILLLVLAGSALTLLRSSRWFWPLVALLALESIAVRTYGLEWSYRWLAGTVLPNAPIAKNTVAFTAKEADKPRQYLDAGMAAHNCYEPSLPHTGRIAKARGMADYQGEAWVAGPDIGPPTGPEHLGSAELLSYVPGRLTLRYSLDAPPPQYITVNTRHNAGWESETPGVEVVSARDYLLTLRVNAQQGEVELRYRPGYRPWQLASFGLTLLAFFGAACFVLPREPVAHATRDQERAAVAAR